MDLCVLLTVSQTRELALHSSRTRMGNTPHSGKFMPVSDLLPVSPIAM